MPDPARAIAVLTAMLEFFAGGRRWIKGSIFDRRGNRCLIGARQRVQRLLGIKGRDASHYLHLAVAPFARLGYGSSDMQLMIFNDLCATYDEVRALILAARDLAQADLDGQRGKQKEPERARKTADLGTVEITG